MIRISSSTCVVRTRTAIPWVRNLATGPQSLIPASEFFAGRRRADLYPRDAGHHDAGHASEMMNSPVWAMVHPFFRLWRRNRNARGLVQARAERLFSSATTSDSR